MRACRISWRRRRSHWRRKRWVTLEWRTSDDWRPWRLLVSFSFSSLFWDYWSDLCEKNKNPHRAREVERSRMWTAWLESWRNLERCKRSFLCIQQDLAWVLCLNYHEVLSLDGRQEPVDHGSWCFSDIKIISMVFNRRKWQVVEETRGDNATVVIRGWADSRGRSSGDISEMVYLMDRLWTSASIQCYLVRSS